MAAMLASVLSIAACTSVPQDGGVSEVEAIYGDRVDKAYRLPGLGDPMPMSAEELSGLLKTPLSLADAERISVESNPLVKANLSKVGIAEADYAQAGRMENPGLTYERFSSDESTTSILFDIGGLVLMPLKRQMEERRLEAARYRAAIDILDHIASTRKSWINAIAERQKTVLIERALETVETSNKLTRQMTALGHSSVIEAAQSELVLGGMQATLIKQRLAEGAARESLIRQLGLWGVQAQSLELPDRLPKLPDKTLDIPAVEQQAIEGRLDVQMAKINLESMAKNLKLTQLNPFLSAIELGAVSEKADGETERGYEIELRLPIFDAGGVKNRKARIVFEQAQAQAQSTAVNAASASREALATYRSSWEIAHHMESQMLPLRQRISSEELLLYNGMLISVFDLLSDLLSATDMEVDHVNAVRAFWLADTNLQSVLTGVGSAEMSLAGGTETLTGGGDQAH
jgi:outer membrane protein TolC